MENSQSANPLGREDHRCSALHVRVRGEESPDFTEARCQRKAGGRKAMESATENRPLVECQVLDKTG